MYLPAHHRWFFSRYVYIVRSTYIFLVLYRMKQLNERITLASNSDVRMDTLATYHIRQFRLSAYPLRTASCQRIYFWHRILVDETKISYHVQILWEKSAPKSLYMLRNVFWDKTNEWNQIDPNVERIKRLDLNKRRRMGLKKKKNS